ncbi:MAG: biotin/lipoyl-binding protein [Desulfobacterales bacterium]|nr:biotin/lipoyl-binding protein [Desulfobacterales bacterium]
METELDKRKAKKPVVNVIFRLVICTLVLTAGVLVMKNLMAMKKPPAESPSRERTLKVTAVRVAPESAPVVITGHGEARALDKVSIAPEVGGSIVAVHPTLEAGEVIQEGDLLFRIDSRDYEAAHTRARASVEQLNITIVRLKKQWEIDRKRLKTLERSRELAENEFKRTRGLFTREKVGAQSGVDAAERALNTAIDMTDQMTLAVALYPIQIKEARSNLTAAESNLAIAETNLRRCQVHAPFTGRVEKVSLEVGQYVTPGAPVLTLANDRVLEILTPLDSRDAREWLRFRERRSPGKTAWFGEVEPVTCKIRWTDDPGGRGWEGRLDRVVAFDPRTRTVTAAIRVEAEAAWSEDGNGLPLVEGMFCSVEIPGGALTEVFRLPRWAVTFENTAYISIEGRLKTVPVEVARIQGDSVFISKGLSPGDLVIITRLVNPMENALLEIKNQDKEDASS